MAPSFLSSHFHPESKFFARKQNRLPAIRRGAKLFYGEELTSTALPVTTKNTIFFRTMALSPHTVKVWCSPDRWQFSNSFGDESNCFFRNVLGDKTFVSTCCIVNSITFQKCN